MKKAALILSAIMLLGFQTQAATDFFGGFINVNGTWFDIANPGANQAIADYDGYAFGTVLSLTINDAAGLTFKNDGSDVTGLYLGYKIDDTFMGEVALPFGADAPFNDPLGNNYTNGGDQRWGGNGSFTGSPIDILTGLSAGAHTLTIYLHATTSDGDKYLNAGGADYTASFAVVPEPSTVMLVGLGLVGAWFVRRRKS